MNPDTILESLQKGFHTTLGAAAFMADLVQHPERRDENIARLRTDWNQLSEEWAVQGSRTEQEAREFVERMMSQAQGANGAPGSSTTSSTTVSAPPDIQSDIQDLTEQISAIRSELERYRSENPQ